MTALFRYDNLLYRKILEFEGVEVFDIPYLDTSLLLTVWKCMRQGVDVWLANPCDVWQRPFKYSPIWSALSGLPLDGHDSVAVGWTADLVFILSLGLLPPVRWGWGLAAMLAATLSPAVVLGVERGNVDIIVFVVAVAACVLAQRGLGLRLIGYGAALLAALMKYYPIVILVLVLRERPRVFLAMVMAAAAAFAAFGVAYSRELLESIGSVVPASPYITGYFGAKNLPFQCARIIGSLVPSGASGVAEGIAGPALYLLLLWVCLSRCRRLLIAGLPAVLDLLPQPQRIFLVTGSAVIAGIFFAGQSVVYREVFFLLTIPGLLAIARVVDSRELRTASRGVCFLILFQLWGTALPAGVLGLVSLAAPQALSERLAGVLWLLRELAGWWTVPLLLAVLADFLRRSPIALAWLPALTAPRAR